MNVYRRGVLHSLLAGAGWSMAGSARASDFPSRRVEIVVPVTPGSATDLLARLLAEKLSPRLGQPVIVVNRPGANQQIGAETVHRAPPDGHTMVLFHSGIMANLVTMKAFTLDLKKDLTPIIQLASTPWVFAVPHEMPVRSIAEFIAFAKANPKKVNFGTTGGTSTLDLSIFKMRAGISGEIIPYPGGTQVLSALATSEIQGGLNSVRGVNSMKGKVRALAVTTAKRSGLAPELPTIAEDGLPGYAGAPLSYGIWGPPGTPPEITRRLNAELQEILKNEDVRKRIIEGMNCDIVGGTAEAYRQVANEELDYYARAAREARIEPQ